MQLLIWMSTSTTEVPHNSRSHSHGYDRDQACGCSGDAAGYSHPRPSGHKTRRMCKGNWFKIPELDLTWGGFWADIGYGIWRTRRIYDLLLLSLRSIGCLWIWFRFTSHSLYFECLGLQGECWLGDIARRPLGLRCAWDLAGFVRSVVPRPPRAWYQVYFPTRLGLGTQARSLPTAGLVWRLFLRQPRAWCGSYFPMSRRPH